MRNPERFNRIGISIISTMMILGGASLWYLILQASPGHSQTEPQSPAPSLFTKPSSQPTPLLNAGAQSFQPQQPAPITPDDILPAFNCARRQRMLPPYLRRSNLDNAAARLLDRSAPLQPDTSGFTLTGQLILDAAQPARECRVGGFDVAQVRDLERATEIGIAVAPLPQPGLYVTVVVGK